MRLLFAGTPEAALPSLEALVASRHEVVAVVTRPDAPAGRGRKLTPSPVAAHAVQLGLPVLKPATPRDEDFVAELTRLAPDACPVVAYGALLTQRVLDIPRLGWMNLHFSVLPRWRGAAPVQRAIMAGDETIGTSCFRIVRELDAGDVYRSSSMAMPDATAGELLAALAQSGAHQLLDALDAMENGETPVPQPADGITVAPKVTVADARIGWSAPAAGIRNLVMGCSPDPGAWCELEGERLKVYRARVADEAEAEAGEPGRLRTTKHQVFAATGDGELELLEVQPAGKRRMQAIDWARNMTAGKALA
ncbi:methionyl-tRNA formyltransferase [Tessaracoccus antarcticus]|uniref:Methionyl-tRNA formyltransferase n=1 Tax=Tessaracoccus antarcticus TaxID=2479848 RepID=A0A3M0G2C0_9ACTN|nr:methionyl-tRNA formyltransferase [Tessaracoccus antarcticus]RMB58728.1 methionyl-tRNA formyltransferase [Tessaracoccus antarcticus]